MTLRMYAERKGLPLDRLTVSVAHSRVHADDCADCAAGTVRQVDRFDRRVRIEGRLSADERASLLTIADRCPVHRTLSQSSQIVTHLDPVS